MLYNFKTHRYEICSDEECREENGESTIRGHINQPVYPTIVIKKKSKAGTCSEYGSLEESAAEQQNSSSGYDKI